MTARRCVGIWLATLTGAGCAEDRGREGRAATAAWCDARPAATVAFTPADDTGDWNRSVRGAPRLVELWRAGGLNEDEELAFPLNMAVSADRRLAIADFGLSELAVVGPDGTWLGTWASPGQGPGELGSPVAASWMAGGGAAVVFDVSNSKVLFVREEEPAREDLPVPRTMTGPVLASGSLAWAGVTPAGTALLQPSPAMPRPAAAETEAQPARSVLLRALPGHGSFDTIAAASTPTLGGGPPYGEVAAPGWSQMRTAVGADGRVAIGGEGPRYRIRLLGPDGSPSAVVCRDAPALPLEGRELRALEGGARAQEMEAAVAGAPRPDSLAPFGRLFLSHEGRLWVQRERPSALRFGETYHGVPGALYDVFDADGAYVGEVRAPEKARLQAALGDTVWAYEIGELDEMWVVAYELRWEDGG